ncbi:MAG: hypothetical protein ACOC1K_00350 [Nanoarchaeota archaeon]
MKYFTIIAYRNLFDSYLEGIKEGRYKPKLFDSEKEAIDNLKWHDTQENWANLFSYNEETKEITWLKGPVWNENCKWGV